MLTKEAIQELAQSQAINAANTAVMAGGVAALPEEYKLHDLEQYNRCRRRARGTMTTSAVGDFAAYAERHRDEDGAAVFIDQKAMSAVAVLNLGTPETPGHCDDKAVLKPERTAAYMALQAACGTVHGQAKLAEFLEDWHPNILCVDAEGLEIPTPRAVAAVRKITIEGLRKAESEVAQLSESRSTLEQVKASSTEPIPARIRFTTIPYHGLAERQFFMRLAIHASDKAPTLALKLINGEKHDEEMAQELASLVREAIGDTMPVMVGVYAAK